MELVALWVVMAIVVAIVAGSKGRSGGAWFLYGLLIWPVALVHAIVAERPPAVADARALAAGGFRKCPFCAELVREEAIVCRHCGRDLPARHGQAPASTSGAQAGAPAPTPADDVRVVHATYGPGRLTHLDGTSAIVLFDTGQVHVVPRDSVLRDPADGGVSRPA